MKFTKQTFRKVYRTFIQAFLGSVVGTIALVDFTNKEALKQSIIIVVIIPAVSAGVAAVMNLEEGAEEYNG